MQYELIDRVGPMEGGARDGAYLEPGEIVDELVFRAESVPLLEAAGAIRRVEESAPGMVVVEALRNEEGEFVSPRDQDADGKPELLERRKRGKSVKEADDGTNTSDGN